MHSKRFTPTIAVRSSTLSLIFALSMGAALVPRIAVAHGERAEPPFLRMATVQWYDTHWSTTHLKVNDELTVSGRFRIVKYWSFAIAQPDLAFLNIDGPGPGMIRVNSSIDGVNGAASTPLELGGHYEYKIVMRGRIPGRCHAHPMLDVGNVGALLGPGDWVSVDGDAASFTDPINTLTGKAVDLEHYGLRVVVSWHLLWVLIAVGWLLYWIRKPLIIPRYEAVQHDQGGSLITFTDRIVGI